jgi:hypothetical protein
MTKNDDRSAVMQIGMVILVFVIVGIGLVILANIIA